MSTTSVRSVCWLMAALLLGCSACRKTPAPYARLNGQAQGTTFNIVYKSKGDSDYTKPVDSLFRLIDRSMSAWDTLSILTGFNQNRQGILADEHFAAVFKRAQEVSIASDGAFDITVGPLVKAWGFSYKKGLPPPDSAQADSLKRLIGYQKVRLENGILLKADPRMEIDFNAIAQGYTVDLIASFLEKQGIQDYLVEIGGEVRSAGHNEQDKPWNIGIDKPIEGQAEGRPLQTTVQLSGKAMATSGSYRKFVVRDGKKYSHAIDPKTGTPITHNLLSISVIADDCTTADAFATAFLVMGMEKAMAFAPKQQLELFCIYTDGQGQLQTKATPGFQNK